MLTVHLSVPDEEAEKQTFEQIYLQYHDDILRRTYRLLGNAEDTKDAMQETWLGVLKSMPLLCGKDRDFIRAYIMSIARNQSIAVLRKRKKDAALFCEAEVLEFVDDGDLFEACESEGISRVMECVNMLSDLQRDVIIMYYLYHRSLREIAELLCIPESVAESRWNHGRARLMTLLKRRGIYEKGQNDGE